MRHRRMRGQVVDDELAQVLGIGGGDPHQVVGDACQVEHHQHSRQLPDRRREVVDLVARVDSKPDGYQRLERPAERRQVDLGVEAADHAPIPQGPQPRQRRRRRHPDAVGEALVGDARVAREQLEQGAVDVVYRGLWMIRHGAGYLASSRRISSSVATDRRIFCSL